MDLNQYKEPEKLERISFLYSEVRLVIAAVALLLGGIPVLRYLTFGMPGLFGLVTTILTLTWIISGLASLYLLYRWNENRMVLFGHKNTKDTATFLVSVVSGINLGIVGLLGKNIGMSIASGGFIFTLTALVYLASTWHLYVRWNASGQKIFEVKHHEV